MRVYMTNALLFSVSMAVLIHFVLIAIYGKVLIQEPNTAILAGEMAAFTAIVVFAIVNMRNEIRRLKHGISGLDKG